MFDLAKFTLKDALTCGIDLRQLGKGATNEEEVANRLVRYVFDRFVHSQTGEKECALVRCFKTAAYQTLETDLQGVVQQILGQTEIRPDLKCLTLLGTAGIQPEWNSRHTSTHHKVIPLPSAEAVQRSPMIAQLLDQLQLDVSQVIAPHAKHLPHLKHQNFDIFYIPEAVGSLAIPAQDEFCIPYHIRSVLGFGGVMPSGDLWVLIVFSKVAISAEVASLFKTLGLNAKLAFLPFDRSSHFSALPSLEGDSSQSHIIALEQLLSVYEQTVLDQSTRLERTVARLQTLQNFQKEALQRSESTNRAILSAIPDVLFRLSREGVYLDVSAAGDLQPLQPPQQLIGQRMSDVLPIDIVQQALFTINQALETGAIQIFEYAYEREGKVNHFEARIVPWGMDEVLAIVRDISERKRAETALVQREQYFRALTENSADVIVLLDQNGFFRYASSSAEKVLGYPCEDVVGSHVADFVPPEDMPAILQTLQMAIQNPGMSQPSVIYRVRHQNGNYLTFEAITTSLLHDPNVSGVVVNCWDVSDRLRIENERKQAEVKLYQLNEHLEALVAQRTAELLTFINALPDYIYVVNRGDMRIPFCNDLFANTIGRGTRATIESKTIFECLLPESAAYFAEQNRQVFESGETLHVQETLALPTGTLYLDTFKIPLKHPDGEVYALIGTSRDITELVKARQSLSDRTAQLEATNRELESFSYSVSHDLRAPLRHISGFVSALAQQLQAIGVADDPKSAHYLHIIEASSQKMGQLIDGLLTLSRVGRRQLMNTSVNLNQLAESAIGLLHAQMGNDDRAIEFQVGDLPTIQGDAVLLQQVFANLIDNALKFSRDRHPAQIAIGTLSDRTIFIKDNGVGFSMEYADQLFGVFQRLHSQMEFEGTGIGLAIVQRIIHRHSGTIWAESKLGAGATFYFKLGESLEYQGLPDPQL